MNQRHITTRRDRQSRKYKAKHAELRRELSSKALRKMERSETFKRTGEVHA